ncbi:GAF domain-containing protein [Ectothiorhodospira mobilis]|uniref:GAF domain-containing protein n=1 Tax=Ectothiorhodospira mobilis TaxID=195064 RepID=UPI001904813C|nr:GAF domain-containing protein [Ectothiorhodospira mobilis]MBK1692791.1 GAF domain-containing protein [Ectothiorhodospira mobilis]
MSDPSFIHKLSELARFVETTTSLEEGLDTLSRLVAHAMDCRHCSIMLVSAAPRGETPRLRVEAHCGGLPPEARAQSLPLGDGIAGRVAGSGEPLLIRDLHRSPYAPLARRGESGTVDVISVPILLEDQVVGVINVDGPEGRQRLDASDLRMAMILALVVSKSIHIHRLQGLLKTHFIQLSLAQEAQRTGQLTQDPERVARLMAHTLYDEMLRAGFARDHVLQVATELLGQVHDGLAGSS